MADVSHRAARLLEQRPQAAVDAPCLALEVVDRELAVVSDRDLARDEHELSGRDGGRVGGEHRGSGRDDRFTLHGGTFEVVVVGASIFAQIARSTAATVDRVSSRPVADPSAPHHERSRVPAR